MTVCTPGRCGLYETARELVKGLRGRGIDSRLVDPTKDKNSLYPKGEEDRGARLADMDWALDADLIVNHSGYDNTPVGETNQPVIHMTHGRPRSSFLSEKSGKTAIYSYLYQKNTDPRVRAVVTFWPEHKPYWDVLLPDKPVEVVQAPVDLDAWCPEGPKGYDFRGKKGRINIVTTDAFRDDIDPFWSLNAFALWARKNPGAKLHVYARPKDIKAFPALLKRINEDGNLGEVQGWVSGLENVYRAADAVITANTIATRTVREATACGCPVIRVDESMDLSAFDVIGMDRAEIRRRAERDFDYRKTAEQFERILDK
jgi:glycosyltransferase involved in cell wall biosynthesis